MAKKTKNRTKQNQKKIQKQKKRQNRIKKQHLAAQIISNDDIEEMVDYALGHLEDGNIKEGERILNKLKKKHKKNSFVWFGLGMIAINDQNFDEAIDCFKEAVNLKPDFTEAHFNLGIAYQDQVKVPEMVLAYRNVIHHGEPGNELISHAEDILNTIEEQLKESDGITLDEYIESYNIFDQGVTYMDTRDWENAIIKFDETIDITPNHPQVYGNIGICYASLGKKEEALDAFDKALKIDPEYEPALLNREIVTSLKEGECLNNEVKAIEYYMDYPRKNKSFIQEYADELGLLPEK